MPTFALPIFCVDSLAEFVKGNCVVCGFLFVWLMRFSRLFLGIVATSCGGLIDM